MKSAPFRMLKCTMPGVQAVEAQSAHSFPRHSHDQFGIGIIRAGAQKSMSGRGMVEAGPGMIITVNPGEVHDGMPIGEAGRRWSMLYFDPHVVRGFFHDLDGRGGDFEFHDPVLDRRDVAVRFERLFCHLTAGHSADVLAAEEAVTLLLDVMLPASRRPSAVVPEIDRARAMIDAAPAAAVSLDDLADLVGASRFQTIRAFARATGLTPHAYVTQRRVALARKLIAEGRALAEAAAESGFFDQSHMNRHFSRIFGVTPGAYAAALQ
jgi:AraC-like DNA-binding protein